MKPHLSVALCLLLVAFSAGLTRHARAQAPPATDIFVMRMPSPQAEATAGRVVNVTNRDGYDNQPFFTPDGRALLYTSMRGDQTDVYRFDLETGAHTRVTRTPESEYSPTPMPGGGFSAVVVEADGAQRLWRFDDDGAAPALVLPDVAPVGYHAWGDAHTLALFVLGEPATLQRVDRRTGRADTLARDIGRSLHRVPGRHAVSFVQKDGDQGAIRVLDLDSGAITTVAPTIAGQEDYAWLPDGTLLMAEGSVLYRRAAWDEEAPTWERVADFAPAGLRRITRLAVSPDGTHLALVSER